MIASKLRITDDQLVEDYDIFAWGEDLFFPLIPFVLGTKCAEITVGYCFVIQFMELLYTKITSILLSQINVHSVAKYLHHSIRLHSSLHFWYIAILV